MIDHWTVMDTLYMDHPTSYVLSYVQDVYMYGMCSCSIKASSSGVTNRWTEVDWSRLDWKTSEILSH